MTRVMRLKDLTFTLIGITGILITTNPPETDHAAEEEKKEGIVADEAMIVGEHRHHMPLIPPRDMDPKIPLVLRQQT